MHFFSRPLEDGEQNPLRFEGNFKAAEAAELFDYDRTYQFESELKIEAPQEEKKSQEK